MDAKTLAGILGHTKASFTLDTYTHTTGDMQKRAAEIVGGFLTDYLGEEMNPWRSRENMAAAPSVCEATAGGRAALSSAMMTVDCQKLKMCWQKQRPNVRKNSKA